MLLATKLTQKTMLNQQLMQAIKLLQYSTLELNQIVEQFLDTNPLVDIQEDEAELSMNEDAAQVSSYSEKPSLSAYADDYNRLENTPNKECLREFLIKQTYDCHFDNNEQIAAEYIINYIDDDGYLKTPMNEIHARIIADGYSSITYEEMTQIHHLIKEFEPIGVASATISECLIKQLNNKIHEGENIQNAIRILKYDFNSVYKIDVKVLSTRLKLSQDEIKFAVEEIKNLEMKPGRNYFLNEDPHVYPDLFVKKIKNEWKAFLVRNKFDFLKINSKYADIIKSNKKEKYYSEMLGKIQEAQMMIGSLKKRNESLLKIAECIVKKQSQFIENGSAELARLSMAEIADLAECHESTVSRIVNKKYIQLPRGVYELKYFFSSKIKSTDGEDKSSKAVKSIMIEIIQQEAGKKTYSDEQLMFILKSRGFDISRRTVTKYRKSLGILSSYERANQNSFDMDVNTENSFETTI